MKRKREPSPPPAPRVCLLDMVPLEVVEAEILPCLDDLEDMRAVWNTCTVLRGMIRLPPSRWKTVWTDAALTCTPDQRVSITRALIAFSRTRIAALAKEHRVYYRPRVVWPRLEFGEYIAWQWRDDDRHRYVNLVWEINKQRWELGFAGNDCPDPSDSRAPDLCLLHPTLLAAWEARLLPPLHEASPTRT